MINRYLPLLSKVLFLSSQFASLIILDFFYDPERTATIFSMLAIASILNAVLGFGANAAYGKFVHGLTVEAASQSLVAMLGMKVISGSVVIIFLDTLLDISPLVLGILYLAQVVLFVDFYSEGRDEVVLSSRVRILAVVSSVLVKALSLIYFPDLFELIFACDAIIWFVGYIFVSKSIVVFTFSKEEVFRVLKFIRYSSSVWISSILQMGWTRGGFLILQSRLPSEVGNVTFIVMRLFESAAVLPNVTASRKFHDLLSDNSWSRWLGYKKSIFFASVGSFLMSQLVVTLLLTFYWGWVFSIKGYIALTVGFLFFYMRIQLSRYMVWKDLVKYSLASYLTALTVSAPLLYFGDSVLLWLLAISVYHFISYWCFLFNSKFREFYKGV